MEKEILQTINYFSCFSYAPNLEETYTFLPKKTTRKLLEKAFEKLFKSKKVLMKSGRYTIEGYSMYFNKHVVRTAYSNNKLIRLRKYVKILSLFSQIKLIGISGSLAMMNADRNEDMDIFIITAKQRLWTGRFISLLIAQLMGLRRRRTAKKVKDKVCLNLFFDLADLKVPKHKRTEYVAHEVLQMKPLVVKENMYRKFLKQNNWVFDIFPNAFDMLGYSKKYVILKKENKITFMKPIGNFFELILKNLQNYYIRRHQTTELITQNQLWFFPDDFELKLGLNKNGRQIKKTGSKISR